MTMKPKTGASRVITITDVEAIPPMIPIDWPSTVEVLNSVWPGSRPSLSKGYSDVKEIAVNDRKAEVTKTIKTMVKIMNIR